MEEVVELIRSNLWLFALAALIFRCFDLPLRNWKMSFSPESSLTEAKEKALGPSSQIPRQLPEVYPRIETLLIHVQTTNDTTL
jgi:hypothetical protein